MPSLIRGCPMTEIQPPPPAVEANPLDESRTYWSIVRRAYWRGLQTRLATLWVILILFLTVFVPFIANPAPYTLIVNGHREFPLIRDLTRVDLIWLVWCLAIISFLLARRQYRKSASNPEEIENRTR